MTLMDTLATIYRRPGCSLAEAGSRAAVRRLLEENLIEDRRPPLTAFRGRRHYLYLTEAGEALLAERRSWIS